jgi:hypothetical protein
MIVLPVELNLGQPREIRPSGMFPTTGARPIADAGRAGETPSRGFGS